MRMMTAADRSKLIQVLTDLMKEDSDRACEIRGEMIEIIMAWRHEHCAPTYEAPLLVNLMLEHGAFDLRKLRIRREEEVWGKGTSNDPVWGKGTSQ